MNNHLMADTQKFTTGFIDSGTTFSYFPKELMMILRVHFMKYCELNKRNCLGAL